MRLLLVFDAKDVDFAVFRAGGGQQHLSIIVVTIVGVRANGAAFGEARGLRGKIHLGLGQFIGRRGTSPAADQFSIPELDAPDLVLRQNRPIQQRFE